MKMEIEELTRKQLELISLNVNSFTEKKGGLTYLSWASAWENFIKVFPKAKYIIKKNEVGIPAFGTPETGYMVYTEVIVNDVSHEMWLPVLDFRNKPVMKPNTFDINKAIMRCLTKNLAMFGLGLYIYRGEDLPTDDTNKANKDKTNKANKVENEPMIKQNQIARLNILIGETNTDKEKLYKHLGITSCKELSETQADSVIKKLLAKKNKK